MKKDLKKLLSAQAQNILPDERVKENIKSELGCSDSERAYAHGGTESKGKKNILVISVAVLMALTLCLCILLPVFLKGTGTPGGGGKFNQIETTEDFYAYGAASVGSLLSASSETRTLRSYRPSDEEMETVGRYMALVEGAVGRRKFRIQRERVIRRRIRIFDDGQISGPFGQRNFPMKCVMIVCCPIKKENTPLRACFSSDRTSIP